MKIALAQMEVIPGMPKKNVENMLVKIAEAKRKAVDLIVFPEMSVGGYLLGDKWTDEQYCTNLMEYNEVLKEASEGIAIAYGNIYVHKSSEHHPNKDGRARKYNAVYVYQNKNPVSRTKSVDKKIIPDGITVKTLLPNYRIFDDERYFFSTRDIADDYNKELEELLQPFNIETSEGVKSIGFEVCEDLWCEDYKSNNEAINSTNILIKNGAEYIINISASPWTYGKNHARDRRVEFLKRDADKHNLEFKPFLYVNCVGVQNNGKNIITFDGGSTIYNTNGKPIILSKKPYLEEILIANDTDYNKSVIERKEKSAIAQKYDAIIQGMTHLKYIMGMTEDPKIVIGMSGGIDSSVVAALLTDALGPDKILGVNMPTVYNSAKTKDAAEYVAKQLGILYGVLPIQELVDLNSSLIDSWDITHDRRKLTELNIENIQAKIRGTSILSNIAAKYGAIFPNNGNKLETALGYATLYGDVGGAFAPIGDLLKTEIFEMAKYINQFHGREIIPSILIPDDKLQFSDDKIKPSAELKQDQIDPMKFGYHDALLREMTDYVRKSPEDFLQWYIDGTINKKLGLKNEILQIYGLDNPKSFVEDMEWFVKKINNNVFKRIQSPPIIITSKSAYGYDIRESMLPYEESNSYKRLKTKVLNMNKYVDVLNN